MDNSAFRLSAWRANARRPTSRSTASLLGKIAEKCGLADFQGMHDVIDTGIFVAALAKKMQRGFDDLLAEARFLTFAKPRDWPVPGGGVAAPFFFLASLRWFLEELVGRLLAVFPRRKIRFLLLLRRVWRDHDSDSRTNIIVTKAKLQGLATIGSDAFSQSELLEARPMQPDHSVYGRPII